MGVDLRLVELQNELYGWITKGDAFTEEDLGMAIAKND